MQITIFGGSGKVGRLAIELALQQGFVVRALVHETPLQTIHPRLQTVEGSVTDPRAVSEALKGSSVAIITLGSWGKQKHTIVSAGTHTIIEALHAQNIRRCISVTGAAACLPNERLNWRDRTGYTVMRFFLRNILDDGEAQLRLLSASNLTWTCIRSPAMTRGRSVRYRLSKRFKPVFATISRYAVAQCLVDQITDTTYICEAPTIRR
jgi:putative NADH-flavin reductase